MKNGLRVDRHFEQMHGPKLAVLAQRIARKAGESPYLTCPDTLVIDVRTALDSLQQVLEDPSLKRKARTQAIRKEELPLKESLLALAQYVEQKAECKSDIHTTGFRPASEQRKG